MKATGIVRRIDDLGRVVIPKEIRKNLRIKDGENIEIFIDGENIILKKYSVLDKIKEDPNAVIAADVNDDGKVNVADSKLLLYHRAEVTGYDLNFKK